MMIDSYLLLATVSLATVNVAYKFPEDCFPSEECLHSAGCENAVQLLDEKDCHKFFKCAGGLACPFTCPTFGGTQMRLVFNPREQVCDWPCNVPDRLHTCLDFSASWCSDTSRGPITTSTTTATSTPTTTTTTVKTTLSTQFTHSPSDPSCPTDGKRLEVPGDCHKYKEWNGKSYIEKKCLEHLVFNCYIEACDYPANVPWCNAA